MHRDHLYITEMTGQIDWEHFYLPNIPIYQAKLPQEVMDVLWGYVDKAKRNVNHLLAGNISQSLELEDERSWFFRSIVGPIADRYISGLEQGGIRWIQNASARKEDKITMNRFWVNFQNKHEFNPVHDHSGLVSFVIWMKIPTHWKDQHALPFVANANNKCASDFHFHYSDMLGNHQGFQVKMAEYQEGWIMVFPAKLRHQVYPFYESDEQRVSISGNISWENRLND